MKIDTGGLRLVSWDYAADERMPPHSHPAATLGLVLRGAVEEGVRGGERQATTGAVVVKPAGVVHRNRFGPAGARMVSISLHAAGDAMLADAERTLARWRWMDGGPPARALWRLVASAADEPARAPSLLADAFWEVLDALEAEGAADLVHEAPPWIRRVRDRLHDEAPAAVSVRAMAASMGVHPVALTRAFRRAYGVPVTAYARRLRLRAAADRVASTDEPLARVAVGAGFADQAHLTRALRDETGLTPGALRRLVRHPRVSPVQPADARAA